MLNLIRKYSPFVVFILLLLILIAAFYFRDLPDKPVIDVIITSLSNIIAAIIAAFVAYQVAMLQIKNTQKNAEIERKKKFLSTIKLLLHEIYYNKEILLQANQYPASASSDTAKFLIINLHSIIWDRVSIVLVEDMDSELFNRIADLNYKIGILKQENTFTVELLTSSISEIVVVHTQLEAIITNS